MKNFQTKRKKSFWQSWIFLMFFFAIILIFAWNVFAFWRKMQDTSQNRKIAEDKISQLQKQRNELTDDIAKLNTEAGVEEAIRDKFGLVKEGENMIVIVEDKNKEVPPVPSRFSRFWGYLKGLFE
jgi:cell division protein FtsB